MLAKTRSVRFDLLALTCILLGVVAVYGQVARFGFVEWDDPGYVVRNAMVNRGLSWEGLRYAFSTFDSGNWHPLTWLSHMLDAELWGDWAGGHHLTNVGWHIGNSLLVFLLFRRLSAALCPSLLVAALFALHPLHVESVAWVSERKDVVSAFFVLAALNAYLSYARQPTRTGFLLVTVWWLCSLMSKAMFVTMPILLLLLDWFDRRKPVSPVANRHAAAWALVREKYFWFVIAAGFSIIAMLAQREAGAAYDMEMMSAWRRIEVSANAYAAYIRLAVLPVGLHFYYPLDLSLDWRQFIAFPVLLGALAVVALKFPASRRTLSFSALWYIITLLPVIGIVKIGDQAYADRYTYLALLGPFYGFAKLLEWLACREGKKTLAASGAVAVVAVFMAVCSVLSFQQVGSWRDTRALAQRALDVQPRHAMGHLLLSQDAFTRGDVIGAERHARDALAHARQPTVRQGARQVLGDVAMQRGEAAAAITHYREGLAERPTLLGSFNLGVALLNVGNIDAAAGYFRSALLLDPGFAPARHNLEWIARHRALPAGNP